MGVKSIIKIELTINAAARSYVVILTLFIEVFGVIYWRLSNMKEKDSVHMVVEFRARPITCSGNYNKAHRAKGRQLIFCGKQFIFHVCPFHVVLGHSVSVVIWNTVSVHFSMYRICV